MTAPVDVPEEDLQARLARIEGLVAEMDALADPAARVVASEVIKTILDLHREALERMLASVAASGEDGDFLLAGFGADPLVGPVLLLHGLHPVDLRHRVEKALESVRPYMRSHSGGVELLSVDGDVVRLRLEGSCHGCPSSAMTMRLAVEKAIFEAAPDIASIEVEGVAEAPARERRQLIPLAMAGNGHAPTAPPAILSARADWARFDELTTLTAGGVRRIEVGGVACLVCRVDGTLYAYRARCPVCDGAMWNVVLSAENLVCRGCGCAFDVLRAGRSAQTPYLLEAIPLLEDGTAVRLAIPVAV